MTLYWMFNNFTDDGLKRVWFELNCKGGFKNRIAMYFIEKELMKRSKVNENR